MFAPVFYKEYRLARAVCICTPIPKQVASIKVQQSNLHVASFAVFGIGRGVYANEFPYNPHPHPHPHTWIANEINSINSLRPVTQFFV